MSAIAIVLAALVYAAAPPAAVPGAPPPAADDPDGNDDDSDACVDCEEAACGDDVVQTGVEMCDGTALAGETCLTQAFPGGGVLACNAMCTFDVSMCCETKAGC